MEGLLSTGLTPSSLDAMQQTENKKKNAGIFLEMQDPHNRVFWEVIKNPFKVHFLLTYVWSLVIEGKVKFSHISLFSGFQN